MPTTSIVSVTHVSGSGYHVVFSDAVTLAATGDSDSNILMYSPTGELWSSCTVVSQTNATTLLVDEDNGDTDCTRFALMAQPAHITSANQFQVAAPINAIA